MTPLDCEKFHLCGKFPLIMAAVMVVGTGLFFFCEWKARKEKKR